MKRIEIVGMSLVAMVAVAAMMASGAQAAEIVSCVKGNKVPIEYVKKGKKKKARIYEGQYKNRKCTELAPEKTGKYPGSGYEGREGKYEIGATGAHFKPASGTFRLKPRLEMANGQVVQCASSAGTGEWTSSKVGTETVIWAECVLVTEDVKGESCTTAGSPPGEIESSPLALKLISYPEELPGDLSYEEGKVFVDSSASTGYYAEFACGPTASFRLTGHVAGVVKSKLNTPGKKMLWYNGPGEGAQDLQAEFSTNGGSSYAPSGSAVETYEVRASDAAGIEVIEPL